MAKGKPGADSSVLVTTNINGKSLVELAIEFYGQHPVFWGRYFTSPSTTGNVEYRHKLEDKILHDNDIRVLPIARQTTRVNGTKEEGEADARANVDDFLATFGADYLETLGKDFYMFLDVEGSPSLSETYYIGWAQTLRSYSGAKTGQKVLVLPCVYATKSDTRTWSAVTEAVHAGHNGAPCSGAWIAAWPSSGCQPLPDWDPHKFMPSVAIPFQVLAWQYADSCHGNSGFDCSETNPEISLNRELLNHLVLPPSHT